MQEFHEEFHQNVKYSHKSGIWFLLNSKNIRGDMCKIRIRVPKNRISQSENF